jgi:hypothetical protein
VVITKQQDRILSIMNNSPQVKLIGSFLKMIFSPVHQQGIYAFYKLDPQKLSSVQKQYLQRKYWREGSELKETCQELPHLPLTTLEWLTFSDEKIEKLSLLMGGLFYAKTLATKVDKTEIQEIHTLFGDSDYRWLLKTGRSLPQAAYPLKGNQKALLKEQGQLILEIVAKQSLSKATAYFFINRMKQEDTKIPTHTLPFSLAETIFRLSLEHLSAEK